LDYLAVDGAQAAGENKETGIYTPFAKKAYGSKVLVQIPERQKNLITSKSVTIVIKLFGFK
jgi:hypothetical protein